MVNLKNRYMQQTKALINRKFRVEICAVDEVKWHKEPRDGRFNTVTVVMRDRRYKGKRNGGETHRRDSSSEDHSGQDSSNTIPNERPTARTSLAVVMRRNWNLGRGSGLFTLYKERMRRSPGDVGAGPMFPILGPTQYDMCRTGRPWMTNTGCKRRLNHTSYHN